MEPRGFWGTFAVIAGITALPFALAWSFLFSLMQGIPFGKVLPAGLCAGAMFGLLFGLVMAALMKVATISVPVEDKRAFLSKVNVALAQIGYHPESQTESFFTYKPSFRAGKLSGRISIQMEEGSATIVGPSMHVKKLQKRI